MEVTNITQRMMEFIKSRRRTYHLTLNGISIKIKPYMFPASSPYSYSTRVLLDSLQLKKGERILEIGTGSGVLSVFSAKQGAYVDGVDILPECVQISLQNAIRNKVFERVKLYYSNIFSNVQGRFDTIICNLPILDGELPEGNPVWYSLFDPGFNFHKALFRQGKAFAPRIVMSHADIAGKNAFNELEQLAESTGWKPNVKFEKPYAGQNWRSYEFTLAR